MHAGIHIHMPTRIHAHIHTGMHAQRELHPYTYADFPKLNATSDTTRPVFCTQNQWMPSCVLKCWAKDAGPRYIWQITSLWVLVGSLSTPPIGGLPFGGRGQMGSQAADIVRMQTSCRKWKGLYKATYTMHTCLHPNIQTGTHTVRHTHSPRRIQAVPHNATNMNTLIHICIRTYSGVCINTYTHATSQANINIRMHTHIHTGIRILKVICICTHTHPHT